MNENWKTHDKEPQIGFQRAYELLHFNIISLTLLIQLPVELL